MLLIFTITYFLSCVLSFYNKNFISSAVLGAFVVFNIWYGYKIKKLYTLKNLFTVGFVGGFAISLLKLSNLSTSYSIKTFVVIYLAYFSYYIGYVIYNKKNVIENNSKYFEMNKIRNDILCIIIIVIILLSFLSFLIEVAVLKFIPILSIGTPHAYSEFHIFMIHYLTTSFILIPPLSVIVLYKKIFMKNIVSHKKFEKQKNINESFFENDTNIYIDYKYQKNKIDKEIVVSILGIFYTVFMSIVLVSRFQLMFSIIQLFFMFGLLFFVDNNKKKISKKILKKFSFVGFGVIIILFILYIIITVARSHSVEYLNGIFDMKNKNIPIFITQPYMYISQNFENLNYMINTLPFFSYGRRMLAPLFSLTLVKKYFPHIAVAAALVVKDELTTNTLIYDFYYDFSFFGVSFSCFVIGYMMNKLEELVYNDNNNLLAMLLYTQMSFYMLFSFFQSFFSLSQTWIYIILSIFIYFLYLFLEKKNLQKLLYKN